MSKKYKNVSYHFLQADSNLKLQGGSNNRNKKIMRTTWIVSILFFLHHIVQPLKKVQSISKCFEEKVKCIR